MEDFIELGIEGVDKLVDKHFHRVPDKLLRKKTYDPRNIRRRRRKERGSSPDEEYNRNIEDLERNTNNNSGIINPAADTAAGGAAGAGFITLEDNDHNHDYDRDRDYTSSIPRRPSSRNSYQEVPLPAPSYSYDPPRRRREYIPPPNTAIMGQQDFPPPPPPGWIPPSGPSTSRDFDFDRRRPRVFDPDEDYYYSDTQLRRRSRSRSRSRSGSRSRDKDARPVVIRRRSSSYHGAAGREMVLARRRGSDVVDEAKEKFRRSRVKEELEEHFTTSKEGLVGGAIGAVVGGWMAEKAQIASGRDRKRGTSGTRGTNPVLTLLGAAVGGLAVNAVVDKIEDRKREARVKEERWEEKWGDDGRRRRSRSRSRSRGRGGRDVVYETVYY